MGFDAFFFGRLDYQDKEKRLAEKEMEWVWRPSFRSLGEDVQIFTHALYHHYSAPDGFDYDTLSNDEPFIVDEKLDTYNAPRRAEKMYKEIQHRLQHYKSQSNMVIVMGDDFHF